MLNNMFISSHLLFIIIVGIFISALVARRWWWWWWWWLASVKIGKFFWKALKESLFVIPINLQTKILISIITKCDCMPGTNKQNFSDNIQVEYHYSFQYILHIRYEVKIEAIWSCLADSYASARVEFATFHQKIFSCNSIHRAFLGGTQ